MGVQKDPDYERPTDYAAPPRAVADTLSTSSSLSHRVELDVGKDSAKVPIISTMDADVESAHPLTNSVTSPSTVGDRPQVSLLWIYVLSIANLGIGSSWALEFAVVTPYFEKTLSSGILLSHGVWVAGPISGLIVAPIIGSLSDRCTSRYGRRRPFIVGGLFATILGMVSFSNADEITHLFFTPGTEAARIASLIIAVVSFCLLDLAINTTMWPIRALQGDLVPENQQQVMQSATVVMNSLGDLAVNGLVQFIPEPISQIRLIFTVASIFYTLTILSLLYAGREKPISESYASEMDAQPVTLNVLSYLRSLPPWMWRIGITNALGFFAFYCRQPNASEWISSSVLHGNPDAPDGSDGAMRYERGVTLYGRAGIYRGIVQIVFSALYPSLLGCGLIPGVLMALSFSLYAVYLALFSQTHSEAIAIVAIVMWALPQATLLSVPMGMTVALSDDSNRGKYLGALNIFAVIPQLIDTAYTGIISKTWGEWLIMYITAFWSLLTALAAFFLVTERL